MIRFQELRITPNNEELIIDVSIDNSSYYQNVVIDSIIIDTQDTYVDSGPSSNAIYTYTINPDEESTKRKRLILTKEDLEMSLEGNLFFVYIVTSGEPSGNAPIAASNAKNVGVVFNLYPIYKQSMCYTKELAYKCEAPKGFIDYILKLKALDISVKTGNYQEAIRYWNTLFKSRISSIDYWNC